MVLKRIEESTLTFDVDQALLDELKAAKVTCHSQPKPAPLPANDPVSIERKRKEELFYE